MSTRLTAGLFWMLSGFFSSAVVIAVTRGEAGHTLVFTLVAIALGAVAAVIHD
jgi:hypothetical protein